MTLIRGVRIGSYEIVAPVGRGQMGEVYRAQDQKLERTVALKLLKEGSAPDPDRLQRFEQEACAASALGHPNIVTIHEIGLHRTVPYVVMELLDGKTLRDVLSHGPLSSLGLLRIAVQIADGLAKAHSAGIVHRNLKPENLMILEDGLVKILDFGQATLFLDTLPRGSAAWATMDSPAVKDVALSRMEYKSPEEADGRAVDHRSDQFAFGAILYEMATGKKAFPVETAARNPAAITEQEPEPIGNINPEVPAPLAVIVNRCLAKDPKGRYDTTEDLARALKSIQPPARTRSIVTVLQSWRRLIQHWVSRWV